MANLATPPRFELESKSLHPDRQRDGSATNSVWMGTFTTQIAGLTPAQIQAIVLGGGSVSSTYSGSFSVNIAPQVPEPATMLLLGTGLAGIAAKVRKRRKAV